MADQVVIATGRLRRARWARSPSILADRLKQELGITVRMEAKELGD